MWAPGEEDTGRGNSKRKCPKADMCSGCSKASVAGVDLARGEQEVMRSKREGGGLLQSPSGNWKDLYLLL